MRHTSRKSPHHVSVHHATKTHVVTNTQLMIAVFAAFLAGGLAFVASPNRQADANSCSVVSMEYGERCRGNRYKGTQFTCSDGISFQLADELCRTTSKIQRMVEESCSSRQCAAPVVVPVVEENREVPPQRQGQSCELTDVRFFNRCGRNQYQGVQVTCSNGVVASPEVGCQNVAALQEYANNYCAGLACNQQSATPNNGQAADTNNPQGAGENTASDPATLPADPSNPFMNGGVQNVNQNMNTLELMGPLMLEKQDQKIVVRTKVRNNGNVDASPDSKYTVSFFGANGEMLLSYASDLTGGLRAGEMNYFSINVTLPLEARSVEVSLDTRVSNAQNSTLRANIPENFFSSVN